MDFCAVTFTAKLMYRTSGKKRASRDCIPFHLFRAVLASASNLSR